jgi:DNA-binding NtrC family response regulator
MARTGKSHEFQQGWPMLDVELPTESLEAGTRRATITAMRRFKNDTSQVAEALGVSRKTVYNYLHKWGLKS